MASIVGRRTSVAGTPQRSQAFLVASAIEGSARVYRTSAPSFAACFNISRSLSMSSIPEKRWVLTAHPRSTRQCSNWPSAAFTESSAVHPVPSDTM
uniref:Uncharacterized protein n=1 Tax=Arundo donax TaxID=35708 RepID=A0A0A9F325_ARUDO